MERCGGTGDADISLQRKVQGVEQGDKQRNKSAAYTNVRWHHERSSIHSHLSGTQQLTTDIYYFRNSKLMIETVYKKRREALILYNSVLYTIP